MPAVPRLRTIYFKQLVDRAFRKFLWECNDSFTRVEKDYRILYVWSGKEGRKSLGKRFLSWIVEDLESLVDEFDIENPSYCLVIGSCSPKNNPFLKLDPERKKIPEALWKIISSDHDIRYYPREGDVRVDPDLLNSVLEDVFLELFDRKKAKKALGRLFRNVFFLRHSSLDCYMAFKILRMEYGRGIVENMVEQNGMERDVSIRSVNERIDEKVSGKISFLKSEIMRPAREEFLGFVRGCLEGKI